MTDKKRDFGFDNLKFILIFLVVFGHFLELCNFENSSQIYKFIYIFHIPLLIFISGYFAKFKKSKLCFFYIPLYILFQTIYIYFEKAFSTSQTILSYTTPYWLLWYLFALMGYIAVLPVLTAGTTKKRVFVLFSSLILSLLIGFEKNVGYFLSLSRFIVFLPFFLMGHYFKKEEERIKNIASKTKPEIKCFIYLGIILLCTISFFILTNDAITPKHLYGSTGYESSYDMLYRLEIFGAATGFILLFTAIIKPLLKNNIPIISTIGKNTLPVFLLHGFIMKAGTFKMIAIPNDLLLVLISTFLILFIFGNDHISHIFNYLTPEIWLKNLKRKRGFDYETIHKHK